MKILLLFLICSAVSCRTAYSQARGEDGPDFMVGALGEVIVRRDLAAHHRQELDGPPAASWSPDSRKIIFWEEDGFYLDAGLPVSSKLYKYNLETGIKKSLLNGTVYQEGAVEIPYFSPDGSKILFKYWLNDYDMGVFDPDNPEQQNKSKIAYIDTESGSAPYSIEIVTGVYVGDGGMVQGATWISDDSIAYVRIHHPEESAITSEIWISDIDGSNAKKLYQCTEGGPDDYESLIQSLHPVSIGDFLYFTVSSGYDSDLKIHYQKIGRVNYTNKTLEWVTADGKWSGGDFFGEPFNLQYDPAEDVYKMTFQSADSYSQEDYIYTMKHNDDLEEMKETITRISDTSAAFPSWTYDGEKVIAVTEPEPGELVFILINSDGSGEKYVETAGVSLPIIWSPDGLFGYVTHGMNLFHSYDPEEFGYSDDPDSGNLDIFVARVVSFVSGTLLGVEGGVARDTAFNRADVDEGALDDEALVSVGAGPVEYLPDMNRAVASGAMYWDKVSAQGRVYAQMSGNKFIPGSARQFTVNKPLRKMARYNIYYSTDSFAGLGVADETKLRAYYWTGSVWERVGGTVDTESQTVSFYSNHSGVYGVFYEPSEPEEDTLFKEVKIQPNPFYPGRGEDGLTRIKINTSAEESVTIEIYNIAGERIVTLLDNEQKPPNQWWDIAWDGRNYHGQFVAGGVYLCWVKAGSSEKIVKIAVIR